MKKLLLAIPLFTILLGCGNENPAENRPSITGISFEGIPQSSVDFDRANSRITVKLPALLEHGLRPVLTLSEGARVVSGVMSDNRVDISSLCSCGATPDPLILKVADDRTTTTYELKLVPAGEIKPLDTNEQATFSIKTKKLELNLPVENLYTNERFTTLHLTNIATGASSQISADGACIAGCSVNEPYKIVLKLGTPVESYVRPGTYSIRLDNLNFSQKLVVTE